MRKIDKIEKIKDIRQYNVQEEEDDEDEDDVFDEDDREREDYAADKYKGCLLSFSFTCIDSIDSRILGSATT